MFLLVLGRTHLQIVGLGVDIAVVDLALVVPHVDLNSIMGQWFCKNLGWLM